jgi:hypothetical protein
MNQHNICENMIIATTIVVNCPAVQYIRLLQKSQRYTTLLVKFWCKFLKQSFRPTQFHVNAVQFIHNY